MTTNTRMKIADAIKHIKENAREKFEATVEVHINLDLGKGQQVRYTTTLPHGTGKTKKIAVFASKDVPGADLNLTEADLEKIKAGDLAVGRDFDIVIAEPQFMPKIAKVATILGPAGAMPNPKSGTVTKDVAETVEKFRKGQIEVRTENSAPLIHTIIGKISWDDDKLTENFNWLMTSLRQNKPAKAKSNFIQKVFVKSTMGKAVEVAL